jgi:Icc-related predicted phosphoesterase
MGSAALLDAVRAVRPRYALFGHVHQPLQQRMRIGRTECVNVGHFRATGRPWVLTWGR